MSEFEINGICLEKYHGNAETVVVPKTVRIIGKFAFEDCTNVKTLLFPGALYEIKEHAFLRCTHLETVTLPDKMYAIAEDAFFGCASLESLVIPDGVRSLGSRTFKECVNLKTLTLPDSLSEMSCFANLERGVTICAHEGSMAEELTTRSGWRFKRLEGTVKKGFCPEVSYGGPVMFYNPSRGIRRQIILGHSYFDKFPGYESPDMVREPHYEGNFIPERILRRMIFSRTGKGYQIVMTLFPRNSDVRKELGCDRMDFCAYLNEEGNFISKFQLLQDGTQYCTDSSLEEYHKYFEKQALMTAY